MQSLLSVFHPGGARANTNVRRDSPFGSNERARLKWKCHQFQSARSRRNRLRRDPKSRSAVAMTSLKQTVSLRCYKAYSSLTSGRLRAPRGFFGPIVKALTRFLSQLPFTHHPSQDFRWSKRFRTEFAMKIFRDVEPHVESDQIG